MNRPAYDSRTLTSARRDVENGRTEQAIRRLEGARAGYAAAIASARKGSGIAPDLLDNYSEGIVEISVLIEEIKSDQHRAQVREQNRVVR